MLRFYHQVLGLVMSILLIKTQNFYDRYNYEQLIDFTLINICETG